jgi:hypothetical protein
VCVCVCVYVTNGTCFNSELTVSRPGWSFIPVNSKYKKEPFVIYIYILPPDDGLLIRLKYVEV